jgi:hypothetical protein
MDTSTQILYQMISDWNPNKISDTIKQIADNLFHFGKPFRDSSDTVILMYINTCSWLLETIKFYIDEMTEIGNNICQKEYTNSNYMHEMAFTSVYNNNSYSHTKYWSEKGLELPFNLVKRIVEEKGYIVTVNETGYREHPYSEWITVYNLQIRKSNRRQRD